MKKDWRIILDTRKWRIFDIEKLNPKAKQFLDKSPNNIEGVSLAMPGIFDNGDTLILYIIYLFNDKINAEEMARLTDMPYPTLKDRLNRISRFVKVNKDNFPNTYTFKDDVEVVPLSVYRNEKLKDWNKFKREWEKSASYDSQEEKNEKKLLIEDLEEEKHRKRSRLPFRRRLQMR